MTPLDRIGLRPRDHKAALWWLGLLYRRPRQFKEALSVSGATRFQAILIGFVLYLHFLPYLLLLVVVGRGLLFGVLGLEAKISALAEWSEFWLWHGTRIATAIAAAITAMIIIGIAAGITFRIVGRLTGGNYGGISWGIYTGVIFGIAFGISFGAYEGTTEEIAKSIIGGIGFGAFLGISGAINEDNTVGIGSGAIIGIAAGIAMGIAEGTASGIAAGITAGIIAPRAYYWLYHFFFIWPRLQPRWYPYHPVVWDDCCGVPFPGLDRLLASYAELEPETGRKELERLIGISIEFDKPQRLMAALRKLELKAGHEELEQLIGSQENLSRLRQRITALGELKPAARQKILDRLFNAYSTQRNSALRARCRLIARATGREARLGRLDESVAGLPEGEKGFLAHTVRLRADIGEIAGLQRRLDTQTRPFLKEPEAALLVEKIRNFQNRVSGYPEPLGSEFRQAAGHWLARAEEQHRGLRRILDRQPRPQVFRAGDPVDREQEAFVPRMDVLGELDRQLSLASGCPGLILYGRRRMGKSTLLRNLDDFLPVSLRLAPLSMQNPDAFTSLADWLALVARPVLAVWPEHERPAVPVTLPEFFRRLGECNERLEASGQRLLLAIDEYENLDRKLGEGVFPEDLLDTLRESIQYHRRIVWLFAGSHAIEELTHSPWPSYLISARTVEVPAFSEAETRLLLTEPMRHSRLFERDEAKRPRFEPGFWGENGIERIQAETAGWPHLVQLLAETAVDLCNERQRPAVDAALLEQAIAKAVVAGDTVLRQLLRGESGEAEWAWLSGFRRQDTLPIPDDEAVYQSLRRRWLVTDAGQGEWRLRVPLLQRWLRDRG
jgi:hypothetical protein